MNQDLLHPQLSLLISYRTTTAFQNKFYFQNLFLLMRFTIKLIQAEEKPPEVLRTAYSLYIIAHR